MPDREDEQASGAQPVARAAKEPDFRARLDGTVDRALPRRLHPYREQVLYLIVGGWNTVFGYAVFAGLYWAFGTQLPVTAILVISWVIAVVNAYVCYRYLVFRSRGRMHREIPRFFVVYAIILAANLLVLPLALRTLPLNAYLVQAIYTLAVVVVSYVGHRLFSFREGRGGVAGSPGGAPNASDAAAAPQAGSHDPKD